MRLTEIQRFCMHDGPGIRTTVFLKGCPLRCVWCHNPETQNAGPELLFYASKCIGCGACEANCPSGAHSFGEGSGHTVDRGKCVSCMKCVSVCPAGALESAMREMTVEQVLREVLKDRAFYGSSGGVTLSGGEPFIQGGEALELLAACKAEGITTAAETCGFFDAALIPEIAKYTDLLLWDHKDSDTDRLKKYTNAPDRRDVKNLIACDGAGIPTVLRCILVRGVNIDAARADGIAELFRQLKNCLYAELLPYHPFGGAKQEALGREQTVSERFVPSPEEIKAFAEALEERGVKVKYNYVIKQSKTAGGTVEGKTSYEA